MSNYEILENYDDERRSIIYYMVKTPMGISNRDFV